MQFKLRLNKALKFEEKNLLKENVLSESILPFTLACLRVVQETL
jgi:hypothetical protein